MKYGPGSDRRYRIIIHLKYRQSLSFLVEIYFNKYYIMEGDLTHEQFETVLKLCDILGLEDFTVAAMMLKEVNWKI